MKLSIVIPCYNMEKYLSDCLNSLLRQDLSPTDFEVILINDGSKDNTLQIANTYAEKYGNIKVIDKINGGVGAARNLGIDLATGTYMYFLDPDDFIADHSLAILLQVIEENQLDILTFNTHDFRIIAPQQLENANHAKIDTSKNVTDGLGYIAKRKYRNEVWWYIVNRNFLVKTRYRFVEDRWLEDAILTVQIFCRANRMAHIELDVHWHRIIPTSAMRNKSPEHYRKIIDDIANAAYVYNDIINSIPKTHKQYAAAINRLKTRQQSFVFFLLVRFMKSDMPVSNIPQMLNNFEQINAYPLRDFLGPDYHGFSYSFMTFIFNKKLLIIPFIKVFRTFYNLAK